MIRAKFFCAVLIAGLSYGVSTSFFVDKSADDFMKGKFENITLSSKGYLMLAPKKVAVAQLEDDYVWDIVSFDGRLYIATGDDGKIYVVENEEVRLFYDAPEIEIMDLLADEDGLYAAGVPGGRIYKISYEGKAEIFCDLDEEYVWDMIKGVEGAIYAATGSEGRLYRIKDGEAEVLADTEETHLLALAGDEQYIYASSSPEGLIYRIGYDGEIEVLFDAEEGEVRALVMGEEGVLFFATAQGAGRGIGSVSGRMMPVAPKAPTTPEGGKSFLETQQPPPPPPPSQEAKGEAQPSPPPPKPPAGANSVYMYKDGVAKRLMQIKDEVFLSLLYHKGVLYAGSGGAGTLYKILPEDDEYVHLLSFDERDVMALCADGEELVVGVGNGAGVYRIGKKFADRGEYYSRVFDAGNVAQWGTVELVGKTPEGTNMTLSTRSGNSAKPDRSWTGFSAELRGGQRVLSSPHRFIQYRLTLTSKDGSTSPTLDEVKIPYCQKNLPPQITDIKISPDNTKQGGQGHTLRVQWSANDPNSDKLIYSLYFSPENVDRWILLEDEITSTNYNWDITAVPDGWYRVKVVASDKPSNTSQEALSYEKISERVLVDNTPPGIKNLRAEKMENGWTISGIAYDGVGYVVSVEYSIDGGEWHTLSCMDGVFDESEEEFSFEILSDELEEGEHIVAIKVRDNSRNTGAVHMVLEVE